MGGEEGAWRMPAAAIRLLVGTTKGAFVLDGDADRARWAVRGPYCDGWPINHVIGDPVDRHDLGRWRRRLVRCRGLALG